MSKNEQAAAAKKRGLWQGDDRETLRAALQEERRGYVTRGLTERVNAVDAQLKKLSSAPATAPAPSAASDPANSAPKQQARRGSAKKQLEDLKQAETPVGDQTPPPTGNQEPDGNEPKD